MVKSYQKIDNCDKVAKGLLLLKDFFDSVEVSFRLGYGTLLGVVRDNNFILGDNDVDLLFEQKDKIDFINNKLVLENLGFYFYKITNNTIALVFEGVTFDCYFFSQRNLIDKLLDRVSCSFGVWCVVIDNFYWNESVKIKFLDRDFLVFKYYTEWLLYTYGVDWRVPKNTKGNTKGVISTILCSVKNKLKDKLVLLKLDLKFIKIYRSIFK